MIYVLILILFCTQVVLFIDAAKVDETRLKELLRKGVEIEHGGRKVKKNLTVLKNPAMWVKLRKKFNIALFLLSLSLSRFTPVHS